MLSKELKLRGQDNPLEVTETRPDRPASPRPYHTPELHTIGKAVELVQGGGGGNYLDANRSRYW